MKLKVPTYFQMMPTAKASLTYEWDDELEQWACGFLALLDERVKVVSSDNEMDLLTLIRTPVIVSCIRTYPFGTLSRAQLAAGYQALSWCMQHWWLCRYQQLSLHRHNQDVYRPRLPALDITHIGPEFVTAPDQAREWCAEVLKSSKDSTILVEGRLWERITTFTEAKANDPYTAVTLTQPEHKIAVKILQCWKLMLLDDRIMANDLPNSLSFQRNHASTAMLVAITMACIAVATDGSGIGDSETNKAMEIELQYPPRERAHQKFPVNESGEVQNKWQLNCHITSCSVGIHCLLSAILHPPTVSFN